MTRIISVHSFRGGTGKSNTTANLCLLMAQQGINIGVVDTDIQSPGIHVLFGLDESQMTYSLNDYLWGECDIEQCTYELSSKLGDDDSLGNIYLIPSSIKPGEIARILREGYDVGLLNDGFQELIESFNLDVLLIDTHPGLNEETLLSIAISDIFLIIMRPDQQDYQGTGVTVEVARKLEVPNTLILVNKTPKIYDPDRVRERVLQAYNCDVAAVLPHSDQMMALASSAIFVQEYPDHKISKILRKLAQQLLAISTPVAT